MGNSSSQPTPATTARKPNFVQEVFTSTPKMSRDQEQPKGALHALQEATRKGKKPKRRKRDVEAEDEEMRRLQLSQIEPEVNAGMEVKETREEILYDVEEEVAEIAKPAKSKKRMSRENKELQRMEAEADTAAASMQVAVEAADPVVKKPKKSRGKPSGFKLVPAALAGQVDGIADTGLGAVIDELGDAEREKDVVEESKQVQHRRRGSSGSFHFRRGGARDQETTIDTVPSTFGDVDASAIMEVDRSEREDGLTTARNVVAVQVHSPDVSGQAQVLAETSDPDQMDVDAPARKASAQKKRKRTSTENVAVAKPLAITMEGTNDDAAADPSHVELQKQRKKRKMTREAGADKASNAVQQGAVQPKHTQGPTPPSDRVSVTPGKRTALAYGTDRSNFTAEWANSAEHASTVRLSQSEHSPTRQAFRSHRQRKALDAGEPAAEPDAERAKEVAMDRERTLELRAVQDATEAYLAPFNADPKEQDIVSPDDDDLMAEHTTQDDLVAATEPAAQRPKGKLKRKRLPQPLGDMQQKPAPPTETSARNETLEPAGSRPILRERAMPGGYSARTTAEQAGRNTDEGRPAKHNPIKGAFSDAEKALVDEIYHHCLQQSGMTETEFKAQIQDWREATILKTAVQDALPNRPIVAIRKFCQRRYHNAETGSWTAEQDEALRKACVSNPGRWVEISALVGRTAASCKDRWRNQVDLPEAHRVGEWTADEESTLREAVRIATELLQSQQDEPLPTDRAKLSSLLAWQPIADNVPARSAKQCREKWSKLNRTRSRKLDRAERKYATCEVGDIYTMLTEIHTAIPDHSFPYEPESRLWATISRTNPTSCYSSAMRRLAIEDAKSNYEESVDVSGTVAASAKAVAEYLEQAWDAQVLRDQRSFKEAVSQKEPDNGTESSGFMGNAQKRLEAQQHLAEEKDRKLAEKRAQRGAAKKARREAGKQALKERIKMNQSSPNGRFRSAARVVESDEDEDDPEPHTVQRPAPISGRTSFVAPEDPTTVDPIQDDTSPDKASAVKAKVVATTEAHDQTKAQPTAGHEAAKRKPTGVPKARKAQTSAGNTAAKDDAPESLVSADPKSPTTRKSTGHFAVPGKFAARAKLYEEHMGDYFRK
ncbi:hypothetical protein B0A48_14993 [Cryoendolithus antarcticus]|uniref:Myb-like domain-containing protein n=1 Tax=Cryoendolithus antarcticus TaxID=1507870 RepID=A0A1V8SJ22_9PEZI|nr:hypothetical protein B0A48_14993 [Cryoendolithus antarcticus]